MQYLSRPQCVQCCAHLEYQLDLQTYCSLCHDNWQLIKCVLRRSAFLKDGLIHKDEFALALFKLHGKENLFVDRVFKIFDSKQNDVVDFEEFVRALSVFHPKAPLNEKADCTPIQPCFHLSPEIAKATGAMLRADALLLHIQA